METVTITMKNPPALFLEADNVSPDAFAGKTIDGGIRFAHRDITGCNDRFKAAAQSHALDG